MQINIWRRNCLSEYNFFYLGNRKCTLTSHSCLNIAIGWWWCETRQSRLLLIGTVRVSFIRFISSQQRQEHDRHPSLFLFFFSPRFYIFYLIPSAQMQKKSEVKIVLFSFLFYTTKKKPIDYQNETTFLIIHSLNNIIHSTKKEKKTGLNHKSSYTFSFSVVPNVNVFYIHLKLHANVSIIDRKKKKKKDAGKGISLTRWRREMHAHTYTGKCLPLCLSTSETIVR